MSKSHEVGLGMVRHLVLLGPDGRAKLQRETVKSLQRAWRSRHESGRARVVVRMNVKMLRNLRGVSCI